MESYPASHQAIGDVCHDHTYYRILLALLKATGVMVRRSGEKMARRAAGTRGLIAHPPGVQKALVARRQRTHTEARHGAK